jgi:hypothetical protein
VPMAHTSILVTQEAEIKKIMVWSQPGKIGHETLSQKKKRRKKEKKDWWSGLRHSSNPSIEKKKDTEIPFHLSQNSNHKKTRARDKAQLVKNLPRKHEAQVQTPVVKKKEEGRKGSNNNKC